MLKGGGTNASLSGEEESETDSDLQKPSYLVNGHARLSTASQTSEDEIRSQAPGQGQEIRVWRGWQEPEQDSEGHSRGSRDSSQAGVSGGRGEEQGLQELATVSKCTASLRVPFCIPYGGPIPLLAYQATFPSTNLPRSSMPVPSLLLSLNLKGGST